MRAQIEAQRARYESGRLRHNVTAHERAKLVAMLKSKPLPDVYEASGRSLSTLLRIADVAHKNGEL